jgi:hypothetical protein
MNKNISLMYVHGKSKCFYQKATHKNPARFMICNFERKSETPFRDLVVKITSNQGEEIRNQTKWNCYTKADIKMFMFAMKEYGFVIEKNHIEFNSELLKNEGIKI